MTLGLAALLLSSCGPSEELVLKEGQTLDGLAFCVYSNGLCTETTFCAELYLKETGRSPPLCVPEDICSRFECADGGECRVFTTFPAEVRCVN
ncbi:MAG TPA: hypothetical protein VFO83_11720 [Aggregicoccus sp.]|nr:hypothetical protein [Aggregicoccus sp.]